MSHLHTSSQLLPAPCTSLAHLQLHPLRHAVVAQPRQALLHTAQQTQALGRTQQPLLQTCARAAAPSIATAAAARQRRQHGAEHGADHSR